MQTNTHKRRESVAIKDITIKEFIINILLLSQTYIKPYEIVVALGIVDLIRQKIQSAHSRNTSRNLSRGRKRKRCIKHTRIHKLKIF